MQDTTHTQHTTHIMFESVRRTNSNNNIDMGIDDFNCTKCNALVSDHHPGIKRVMGHGTWCAECAAKWDACWNCGKIQEVEQFTQFKPDPEDGEIAQVDTESWCASCTLMREKSQAGESDQAVIY